MNDTENEPIRDIDSNGGGGDGNTLMYIFEFESNVLNLKQV